MLPSYMEILSLYIDDLAQRLFKQWLQFLTQGSTACLTKKNRKPYIEIFVPHSSVGKESACNAGDPSLIPGSGRSNREGKGYPLQYSGLENSVHGAAKSQTRLSDFHFLSHSMWIHQVSSLFSFYCVHASSLSHLRLFAPLWTVARQDE